MRGSFCSALSMGLLLVFSIKVQAQSSSASVASRSGAPTIIDVRRSLPLDPTETVYHDFYLNAGSEAGLKKGMYLPVIRQTQVQDPALNKQQAVLTVTVGYLIVIQVEKGLTVARMFAELSDEERPALEYESIMIGDRVEVGTGSMKAPSVKAKPKPRPHLAESSGSSSAVHMTEHASTTAPVGVQSPNAPPAVPVAATVAPSVAPLGPKKVIPLQAGGEIPLEKTSPPQAPADMVRGGVPPGSEAVSQKAENAPAAPRL
jgi:hypothetical protein